MKGQRRKRLEQGRKKADASVLGLASSCFTERRVEDVMKRKAAH